MGLVSGIAVYIVLWWVVIFAVLPLGAHPPDAAEPGHDPGAPANPRLGLKIVLTTAISAVLWLALHVAIGSGILAFREP